MQRYLRLKLFLDNDQLVTTYGASEEAAARRAVVEDSARQYIHNTTPEKYHNFIVPEFPLGKDCFRDPCDCLTKQIRLQTANI